MWRVWLRKLLKLFYSPLAVRFWVHQHMHPFFVAGVHGMDLRDNGALSEHHQKTRHIDDVSSQWRSGVPLLRSSGYCHLGSRFHDIRWCRLHHQQLLLLEVVTFDKTFNLPADKPRYRCLTYGGQFPLQAPGILLGGPFVFVLLDRSTDSSGPLLTAG